ncbi:hypothetical protein MKK54_04735 [Methylobacterium sp. J-068]|nr:hypothetical protein [Methylobacterium sp. J-068]
MIESALTEMVENYIAEPESDFNRSVRRRADYWRPDTRQAEQDRTPPAAPLWSRRVVQGRLADGEADLVSLQRTIQGFHLRAARALLDWPMPILAECSALSLSTVKRLEDDRDSHGTRSRRKAITALSRAGIRFLVLADGSIAVAKRTPCDLSGNLPDDASSDTGALPAIAGE